MTTLKELDPKTVHEGLKEKRLTLIDIREVDEYAREHIPGALSIPLSTLETSNIDLAPDAHVVFHCRSGMRTNDHCERLASHVRADASILKGGLNAWKEESLPIQINHSAPLEINRQVQITAGSIILAGVVLGAAVNPLFYALSGFIGAGLVFAGVSGWCGMAHVLSAMPWNRRPAA